jgi:hypothetical protein
MKPYRIKYNTGSDSHGRCLFDLFWMADYHPGHPDGEHAHRERGQGFFGDPSDRGFDRPEVAAAKAGVPEKQIIFSINLEEKP